MELLNQIAAYRPCCEQEETDRRLILQYAEIFDDLFTRQMRWRILRRPRGS